MTVSANTQMEKVKTRIAGLSHKQQALRLGELRISHRAAARDLGVAASVFSRYLLHGELSRQLAANDLPGRVERYITAAARSGSELKFQAQPISGLFSQLGISLAKMSDATGIDYLTLKRGIYSGQWPNEKMLLEVKRWVERELELKKEGIMLTKISLPQEVLDHFGLKRDPFSFEMNEPDDILDMKEIARGERKIMNCVDKGGWIALTGPVGCGKSTLIKKIRMRVSNSARRDVVLVEPRTLEKQFLGAGHICDAIIEGLNVVLPSTRRTLEYRARSVARALEEAHRDGKKVVLLIDEAHLLRVEALLALKRLYEFESGFTRLLSIILVGQELLARQLKTNYQLSEVSQRVDLFELGGLNGSLSQYVRYKLERAGCARDIFDHPALRAIGKRFDTPLAINNLAAAALIHAHSISEKTVTAEIVDGIVRV